MRKDSITQRFFMSLSLRLCAPISIGSGQDTITDMDILRDAEGIPYIPGTSIAGVLRSYLNNSYMKYMVAPLFGDDSSEDNGKMSSLYFYDAPLCNYAVEERELVSLDAYKTSIKKSKFDLEAVSAGTMFDLRLEGVVRKENDLIEWKKALAFLVRGIELGEIRLGKKTNRGFGKLSVQMDKSFFVEYGTIEKPLINYLDFDWETNHQNENSLHRLMEQLSETSQNSRYSRLTVELDIPHSINIRSYPKTSDGVDMEMFSSRNTEGIDRPTIPGTSWAGALRHHARKILKELGFENPSILINHWFGFVKQGSSASEKIMIDQRLKKWLFDFVDLGKAQRSRVIIDESELLNTLSMHITRVKIDRFTGGAVDGALFDERPVFLGKTCLNLFVEKSQTGQEDKTFIALLLLIIRDLCNGLLAVGGETGIGRGIFKLPKGMDFHSAVSIDGVFLDQAKYEEYQRNLSEMLLIGGGSH